MDIQKAIENCQYLEGALRAKGWGGQVSLLLNWHSHKGEACIHVEVRAPKGAGDAMQNKARDLQTFLSGSPEDINDLFIRARSYINHLSDPETEALGDVVAQIARIAETAEQYGIKFDENGQAWDGLAAFLRKASQQLAERGLPRPEQFRDDPIAPEEGR